MTRTRVSSLLLSAGILLFSTQLFAHHGTGSSYDSSKAFEVKGTITEFRYANPHPQLFFDVKDEKGNVVHWTAEIGPNPAQLVQAGWGKKRSEAALAPGTVVTLTLSPSRAGGPVGLVNKIVGADGQMILVGFGNPGAGAGGGEGRQGQP